MEEEQTQPEQPAASSEPEPALDSAPSTTPEEHQKMRDKYVEWADKQIEQLTSRHTHSGEEFDKQIVALAGGGLALTITLAKDLLDKNIAQLLWVLFASWGGFLLALVVNLLSHRTSTKHYNLMIERMNHYRYSALVDEEVDTELEGSLNKRISALNPRIEFLNTSALVSCLGGIILFIIFITYNKYHENGKHGPNASQQHAKPHSRHSERTRTDSAAHQSSPSAAPARVPAPGAGPAKAGQ